MFRIIGEEMKKILLLTILITTFSYSKGCNFEDLTTLDKVEKAQDCMITQLKDLENYFDRYHKYDKAIHETLELLNAQAGNCRKWKLLFKETGDEDYKISVKDCDRLYLKRNKQYLNVARIYNSATGYYEQLKKKIRGLELKKETLKLAADIVGTR
jgi:hypothetical protein